MDGKREFLRYRHQNANGLVLGADVVLPVYMFTGSAVDTVYFPGLVRYEADPRYGAFVDAHLGRAMGKVFASINGKTLNVDNSDNYSPGFVQSAAATHLIWQGGIGMDYRMSRKVYAGGRVAAFMGTRADHTMSWNEPGPNQFGYRAALLQLNLGYGF